MLHRVRLNIIFVLILLLCAGNNSFAQLLNKTATITLHFINAAGNKTLQLDSGNYINAAGEQFNVKLLQYFISNIQFTNADGKKYMIPQDNSYFFVQEDDSASQFCTVRIPEGNYKFVSFMLGVDSLRCASKIDKRTGVLDPSATDMYWGWNSGYIFFKMEGISPAAPEDPIGLHKFRYHIGGFGGYQSSTINNIKMIKLDIPNNNLLIKSNSNSTINIKADILKLFSGSTQVSIAAYPSIMFDAYSTNIANNYASMFSIESIKN